MPIDPHAENDLDPRTLRGALRGQRERLAQDEEPSLPVKAASSHRS